MHDRREVLARSGALAMMLAGAGLWSRPALAAWPAAAFDTKGLADLARALGGLAPQEHKAVTLVAPEMAENGSAVPMQLACSMPGLRRLAVMVEKNPVPLAALFEFGEGAEANVNTRLKMAQTSAVYAVALMADGRVFYTQREIKVTLGGCGS